MKFCLTHVTLMQEPRTPPTLERSCLRGVLIASSHVRSSSEGERAESKASLFFPGSAAAVRLDAFPMRRGRSVTALFQWEATEAVGVFGLLYHPFLIFTLSGF